MLPTEDLFTYVYVLVDDLITAGAIAIPPRPGPASACSDAELLAIAIVRHLLSGRSEAGFLAEVARDWSHLFPILPHQSEANRRIRWLWGAFEQFRRWLAGLLPADNRQQVDTSALPADYTPLWVFGYCLACQCRFAGYGAGQPTCWCRCGGAMRAGRHRCRQWSGCGRGGWPGRESAGSLEQASGRLHVAGRTVVPPRYRPGQERACPRATATWAWVSGLAWPRGCW